jgi:hypothetical protein
VLKQPKPVISMCGPGHAATMFYQFPDNIFKDNLAQVCSITAMITVSGDGSISAAEVQDQIA